MDVFCFFVSLEKKILLKLCGAFVEKYCSFKVMVHLQHSFIPDFTKHLVLVIITSSYGSWLDISHEYWVLAVIVFVFLHNVNVCLACVLPCVSCLSLQMPVFSTWHRAWKHLTIRGILEGWRDSTLAKWLLLLWSVTPLIFIMIHSAVDTW